MAWEHSYTNEAYNNVRANLEKVFDISPDVLWRALTSYNSEKAAGSYDRKGIPDWRGPRVRFERYKNTPKDLFIDLVMEAIMDVYLCSNGGAEMYIDFSGYHSVPVELCLFGELVAHFDIDKRNEFTQYRWEHDEFVLDLCHVSSDGERDRWEYRLMDGLRAIFQNDDFTSPVHWRGDKVKLVCSVLGFLTLGEGDTDSEYFDSYTQDQIKWRDSYRRECLFSILVDMEETEYRV